MTFSATLFVTGIALLILGLIGRITIHEIQAGTENRLVRAFFAIFGIFCISGGLVVEGVFRELRPVNTNSGTPQILPRHVVEIVADESRPKREEPREATGERNSDKQISQVIPAPVKQLQPPAEEKVKDRFIMKAVIDDPDGYTNLRSMPSTRGQIIKQIQDREVFYTYVQTESWWHVRTSDGKYGFVHSSRIKTVSN